LSVAPAITISIQRKAAVALFFALLSGLTIAGYFVLRQPTLAGSASAGPLAPTTRPSLAARAPAPAPELPSVRATASALVSASPIQRPSASAAAVKSRLPAGSEPRPESVPKTTSHDDPFSKRY
jgi:hypothetical protein